jgi:hypothetical protein
MIFDFISQDKNYIIEIQRVPEKVFSFSSDNKMYKFTIKSNLGGILKEFNISYSDIYVLIDNLCYFIEGGGDVAVNLTSTTDTFGTSILVRLYTYEYYLSGYIDNSDIEIIDKRYINRSVIVKDKIAFCNIIDDGIIPIIEFEITDNILDFIDMLIRAIEGM